ncbi:uncharacterized protein LOC134282287 [Saccostrea cucullata]|uniref:uncharacterized protein LOC134282287 n=1 Tax=Saccostrea cuccullata TaxID=36930 RepID=UPI002ED3050B
MATAQEQDIICCHLCPKRVEHHCNLCHVDLCLTCVPNHMADTSRDHEIVGFTFSGKLKMMDDPVVLKTVQSPYGGNHWLWRIQCVGRDKILVCGSDSTIKEIDKDGSILNTIHTNGNVWALSINFLQEPVFFTVGIHKKDVCIYTKNEVKVLLSIHDWYCYGLNCTVNGDLLVSMRSTDCTQSRVVRYSGTTEILKIQYDSQGQPLFSSFEHVLLLTENGNGDICVADRAGHAVVVVDSTGGLRFKYKGNQSKHSMFAQFHPMNIATDVNTQILISEESQNIIHIIDCDGNFVRYIKHPCNGGLSVDADHNLVSGDIYTGEMKIIRYLE